MQCIPSRLYHVNRNFGQQIMERRFIELRPTGPDTEVATNSYKKKGTGNVERIRAELFSYKKAKALEIGTVSVQPVQI